MSEEEIKKIAKAFELDMYPTMPDMLSCKAMLEWLSKDYCIVPKSKVMEIYNRYHPYQRTPEQVVKDVLEILFGKSIFE